MNENEARAKAYFIVALLTQGIAEHLPEMFDLAAEKLEVAPEDMEQVRREMETTVAGYLHSQGQYYRSLAQHQPRVKVKRKQDEPTRHDEARGEQR